MGFPIEGGCDCRRVRYRMETGPLFVHCCHCRWCQRESGASFALNAMIEADRVSSLAGAPEIAHTLESLYTQILRLKSADSAAHDHAGAALRQSLAQLGEELDAVAEAME